MCTRFWLVGVTGSSRPKEVFRRKLDENCTFHSHFKNVSSTLVPHSSPVSAFFNYKIGLLCVSINISQITILFVSNYCFRCSVVLSFCKVYKSEGI